MDRTDGGFLLTFQGSLGRQRGRKKTNVTFPDDLAAVDSGDGHLHRGGRDGGRHGGHRPEAGRGPEDRAVLLPFRLSQA